MISIILAEGSNIVRAGVRSLLERDGGFNQIIEVTTGLEVLSHIKGGKAVDIVFTDMNMPGLGGIELVEKLKLASRQTRVIIFTSFDNEKYIKQAFEAGACGYLLKSASSDELVFSIKHVHGGGHYVCSDLALRLLDKLMRTPDAALADGDGTFDFELNSKEVEILALISEGFTNQEIADKIFTSKRTIEGHRQTLLAKTGSRNMASLIKFAVLNKLIR
ncbi:MAG: response regulator transcription factor [Mucilaginibacter sp.]